MSRFHNCPNAASHVQQSRSFVFHQGRNSIEADQRRAHLALPLPFVVGVIMRAVIRVVAGNQAILVKAALTTFPQDGLIWDLESVQRLVAAQLTVLGFRMSHKRLDLRETEKRLRAVKSTGHVLCRSMSIRNTVTTARVGQR